MVSSDLARANAAAVASLASRGLITNHTGTNRYGRYWRITFKGTEALGL